MVLSEGLFSFYQNSGFFLHFWDFDIAGSSQANDYMNGVRRVVGEGVFKQKFVTIVSGYWHEKSVINKLIK